MLRRGVSDASLAGTFRNTLELRITAKLLHSLLHTLKKGPYRPLFLPSKALISLDFLVDALGLEPRTR